jgi:ligand-binding sensor domain-containing protein
MSSRLFYIASFLIFCGTLQAQQGNYFLTHYTPSDERIDYVTYGMAQGQRGVIYVANKNGVLEFDGRNWSLITTPGPIYTVSTLGSDVFAAGYNGFGKLNWGKDNIQSYQSLSEGLPNATHIFSSVAVKDHVYFLEEQNLHSLPIHSLKPQSIKADPSQGVFTGLFEIFGDAYVNTEKQGLFKIENDKLIKASITLPENQSITFCSSLPDKKATLIGGEKGNLFVYTGSVLNEIPVKDKSFLESNVIVSGTWVSETLIAIGTLRGGVIFINPQSGKTEEITNFFTGLPDNEVYSILCDRNQGVWIAHDYGFTRVAPYLPFRSYSHYPGLSGNLLCAQTFNDQIYAGTTLGLFGLVREEVYENAIEHSSLSIAPKTGEQANGKKGIFSFLKRGKQTSVISSTETASSGTKSKSVLKSFRYVFKKVEGIDGKVSQLVEANGKLLAAGISGVMEIEGLKSKTITREPVRSVFLSPSINQLLASTLNEEIKTYAPNTNGWKETHLLDTLQDYVSYIFEDKLQNIWLCSRTNVYKVETVDNVISNVEAIPFPNPSIDETIGLAYGSEIYVAASGTFNRFNIGKNRFEKHDSVPGPKKYFASAGYFWFYDGHRWRTVDSRVQAAFKLEWLGLFQNIRFLAPADKENGLWVITAANELYKFSSNKVATERTHYPLFLREVRGQESKLTPARTVTVSQLESTVTFEFIQPDYLGMKAIEYRYAVRGLTKGWSAWSASNNIVNFSYLPTGSYRVEVQTRDIMGKISEAEQIDLEVEPPYWKQSWFYAAELVFFGLLVFITIRASALNAKYKYISQLLSLLTVIMLIQFIQTIVSSQISFKSTPVIDFFIQVFIALLVLPIEGYIRKVMRNAAEAQMKQMNT